MQCSKYCECAFTSKPGLDILARWFLSTLSSTFRSGACLQCSGVVPYAYFCTLCIPSWINRFVYTNAVEHSCSEKVVYVHEKETFAPVLGRLPHRCSKTPSLVFFCLLQQILQPLSALHYRQATS